MRRLAIAALVGLGVFAHDAWAQGGAQQVAAQGMTVEVQNERDAPVTIFLKNGRFDRRLGIVRSKETKELALPDWASKPGQRIQLLVHADGEPGDLGAKAFLVQSAGRISLQIPPRGWMDIAPEDTMLAVLRPEELAEATLTVDNPRDRAVTVYAEQGTFDVRLGRVAPRSKETLRFPETVVGADKSMKLFVTPDGGRDLSSQRIKVKKGEHVGLRVPMPSRKRTTASR